MNLTNGIQMNCSSADICWNKSYPSSCAVAVGHCADDNNQDEYNQCDDHSYSAIEELLEDMPYHWGFPREAKMIILRSHYDSKLLPELTGMYREFRNAMPRRKIQLQQLESQFYIPFMKKYRSMFPNQDTKNLSGIFYEEKLGDDGKLYAKAIGDEERNIIIQKDIQDNGQRKKTPVRLKHLIESMRFKIHDEQHALKPIFKRMLSDMETTLLRSSDSDDISIDDTVTKECSIIMQKFYSIVCDSPAIKKQKKATMHAPKRQLVGFDPSICPHTCVQWYPMKFDHWSRAQFAYRLIHWQPLRFVQWRPVNFLGCHNIQLCCSQPLHGRCCVNKADRDEVVKRIENEDACSRQSKVNNASILRLVQEMFAGIFMQERFNDTSLERNTIILRNCRTEYSIIQWLNNLKGK